jgi:taurine dioxygenase
MGFSLHRLQNIGAEVRDLDLRGPLSDDLARDLYSAWLDHGVLLFREAGTSKDIHLRLSRVFGELEEHPIKSLLVEDEKELIALGEKKGAPVLFDDQLWGGFIFFHQDTSYTPNICKGSMLRMLRKPERGGDTIWTDTAKAYAALPPSLKERIADLSAIYCFRSGAVERRYGWSEHAVREAPAGHVSEVQIPDFPLVSHPMVARHPESGIGSLLISPLNFVHVEGMEKSRGDALYEEIVRHALRPEFAYHHKWSVNDLVLWDNRRTMHCALGYPYEQTRIVHRTTLHGPMQTGHYYRANVSEQSEKA